MSEGRTSNDNDVFFIEFIVEICFFIGYIYSFSLFNFISFIIISNDIMTFVINFRIYRFVKLKV